MNKISNLKSKILSFQNLNYSGWNGYDALPISEATIQKALLFLNNHQDMSWEVFPTGRDSIQFEKGDGDNYEEIEIKG